MGRCTTLGLCLGLVLPLLSCAQGTSPTAPPVAASTDVGGLVSTARGSDLLAGFHIKVDPETLEATATPHRTASAQPPQAQRYDQDIANFQNADSFRVTGVQVLGSGNFRITFSHAHPFPAPNIANPATGTNRADLGYTGRVVILTSYNPKSFFSNAVRLSAGAVVAPDGYVEVGDLLANAGPSIVTAYPYKLLADESLDNRIGISNGAVPIGTYDSVAGGWQRANLGPAGTGWTGYDYLHGGQSISNTITLDKDALSASNFSLDVALLIQYTDPRGAGGATFRLPPAVVNSTNFAYRLPHAALDCSKISYTQNFEMSSMLNSFETLEVRVRDWDTAASEAGDATLGDEGEAVDLVTAGASGAPEVVLDAPGILAGLRNMGTGTGTGLSNDPVFYSNDILNQTEAGPGEYFGCLRITDPEFNDPARGSFHAGVDATTLLPDAARAVPARTWQLVPITITQALQPPVITGVTPIGIVGAADEFITFYASWTGGADSFEWDFPGGGVRNATSTSYKCSTQLAGVAGTYSATVTATGSGGTSAPFGFTFRILPPMRPTFAMSEITTANMGLGESDDRMMLVLDGRPVVFFTEIMSPPVTYNLWVAQATTTTPNDPSDWNKYIIAPGGRGVVSASFVNGRLAAVTGTPNSSGVPYYVYATTNTPTSPADWVATEMVVPFAGDIWGTNVALVDYANRPAVLMVEFTSHNMFYFRSNSATPVGAGNWGIQLFGADLDFPELLVVTGSEGARPVAVVADLDTATLSILGAEVAEPSSFADWSSTSLTLTDDILTLTALEGVSGETAKVHVGVSLAPSGDLLYLGFQGDTATTLTEFTRQVIPGASTSQFTNVGPKLIRFNDRLAIGYSDSAKRYGIARALRVNPQRTDWDVALLPTTGSGIRTDIAGVNNALVALVQFGNGNFYNYGQADGPW